MSPFQEYAVMVICAGDVDAIWHTLPNQSANPVLPAAPDANIGYITAQHWQALAQVRCDDVIITKGLNTYYGLLLRCTAAIAPFQPGDFLMAVRGTMDPLEWLNDALAELPQPVAGAQGLVGRGFWDVYASMTLNDLQGGLLGDNAAVAIAARVKAEAAGPGPVRLYVVGHSLGSALATYLTRDLETALATSSVSLQPFFFASPRTGTKDWVDAYQAGVTTYSLINYASDLVPQLPSLPPFQPLNGGGPTHDVHIIPTTDPNAPPSNPANNHSPVNYARMLDPANPVARALTAPQDPQPPAAG